MIKNLQQRYILAIVINSVQFCFGIQCQDECCYWYRKFPATPSSCLETNQTSTVNLFCEIQYWALNNNNNIEVNWYRSGDEESAGIEGEIILNKENRYLKVDGDPIIVNQTFIRQYILGILRFSSSDRGYYWCQMVVNNVSLSPSPYGHFYGSQCIHLNAICSLDQPICAQNLSVRSMAYTVIANASYNCLLQELYAAAPRRTVSTNTASTVIYHTSPSTDKMTSTAMSPTIGREKSSCDLSSSYACAAGITSGMVVLILSSLMVMVLCFVFIQKNRRHRGNMNLDTKDVQYDSTDTGEHKEDQTEEISESYYSEIVQNDTSDFGYTMKPNISYSTLQTTNTTISGCGHSIPVALIATTKQSQSSDYNII